MPGPRPKLSDLVSKAANRARVRGVGEIGRLGARRIAEEVRSDDALIFFTRSAGGEAPRAPDLSFRVAGPRDAAAYALTIGTDSERTFVARLTAHTRCFVVERSGTIVHASWVTTGAAWTRELRAYVVPPDDDAYIYESFTHFDARGLGIYPFALKNIAAELGTESKRAAWVAAEADNPSSIRAIEKAGFERAFEIAFRRSFGWLFIDRATGPRAASASSLLSSTPGARGL